MEVGDLELLMLVNNYQQRFNEPTFSTLDDIPEALIIEVLDDANYIEDETAYYSFSIEEWNEYSGEIYGKDS